MTYAAHAAGRVMLMVSPPGSGRSTRAEILKKCLCMTIISADGTIERNSQKFQNDRIPSLQGVDLHLDPALTGLLEPGTEQELKDYHREFDLIRQYFPEADIRTADGTKPPAEVAKQIRKMLKSRQS
jgi:adenylate kinase family enzyme